MTEKKIDSRRHGRAGSCPGLLEKPQRREKQKNFKTLAGIKNGRIKAFRIKTADAVRFYEKEGFALWKNKFLN